MASVTRPEDFAGDENAKDVRKFLNIRKEADAKEKSGSKTGRRYTQRLLVAKDDPTKIVFKKQLGMSLGTWRLERDAKQGKGRASMKELANTFQTIVQDTQTKGIKEGYQQLATDIYDFLKAYNTQKATSPDQKVAGGVMSFF